VKVTLRLTTQQNAVVVPNEAVQAGQNGQFIYVVKPDRTVEARPVTVGQRVDQDLVIQQGLAAGEVVVTEGQLRLAPNNPNIKVVVRDGRGGGRRGEGGGGRRGEGGGGREGGPGEGRSGQKKGV
jgi:membrane fusion protein, multidrug efflux system